MKVTSLLPSSLFTRVRIVLAVAMLGGIATLSAAERASIKLLTIGNSFADNATNFLPDLAKAGGKQLLLFRANLGGCSFERHAGCLAAALANPADPKGHPYKNNPVLNLPGKRTVSLPEALAAQPWDVVTIQQWSKLSYKPETFQPFADNLIAAIRKYAPTAKIVVHETWAYREDHPFFKQKDGFTPAKMYAGLRNAYRGFADGKAFAILPVGDAINLARQTPRWTYIPDLSFDYKNPPLGKLPVQKGSLNVGWNWSIDLSGKPYFALDAIHCNAAGRYLGAAVWYEALFETNGIPAYTPKELSPEDAAGLRLHARAAVQAERAREASLSVAQKQ